MHDDVPVMTQKALVMRQCLFGFLKIVKIETPEDVSALSRFCTTAATARAQTKTLAATLAGFRKASVVLRKRDLSLSLNEATRSLEWNVTRSRRTVNGMAKDFRRAEVAVRVKLWWIRFWRRLP
jgi:hypothetical protein